MKKLLVLSTLFVFVLSSFAFAGMSFNIVNNQGDVVHVTAMKPCEASQAHTWGVAQAHHKTGCDTSSADSWGIANAYHKPSCGDSDASSWGIANAYHKGGCDMSSASSWGFAHRVERVHDCPWN